MKKLLFACMAAGLLCTLPGCREEDKGPKKVKKMKTDKKDKKGAKYERGMKYNERGMIYHEKGM